MKLTMILFFLAAINPTAQAQNWMKAPFGGKCKATYTLNMKVTKRVDASHLEVETKSMGHSPKAFVELNASSSLDPLPNFGEGFLDIFVEKQKSKDGYDYWKECQPKKK